VDANQRTSSDTTPVMTHRSPLPRRLASRLYDEACVDLALSRYGEALAKLSRVLDLVPDFPGARRKLAAADRACRLDAQYHVAIGHALAGRWYEALRAFRTVEREAGFFPTSVHWIRVCRCELQHEREVEARQPAIPLNAGTLMVSMTAAGSSFLMMCAGAWLTMSALLSSGSGPIVAYSGGPSHTAAPGEFQAVAALPFATPSPTETEEIIVAPGGSSGPTPSVVSSVAAPVVTVGAAPAASTPVTRVTAIARRATSTATRAAARTPTRTPVPRAPSATPVPADAGPTLSAPPTSAAPAATIAPTLAPAATSTPTPTPGSVGIVSVPTPTPQPTSTPAARPTATPATVNVVVRASEYTFNPGTLEFSAGARVHLTLVNAGSSTLDWVLLDSHGIALVKVMAGAGQVVSRDFTAPPAGTYNFVCDVADYAIRGMKGTAYVSPR
jgi:plastocyanin